MRQPLGGQQPLEGAAAAGQQRAVRGQPLLAHPERDVAPRLRPSLPARSSARLLRQCHTDACFNGAISMPAPTVPYRCLLQRCHIDACSNGAISMPAPTVQYQCLLQPRHIDARCESTHGHHCSSTVACQQMCVFSAPCTQPMHFRCVDVSQASAASRQQPGQRPTAYVADGTAGQASSRFESASEAAPRLLDGFRVLAQGA